MSSPFDGAVLFGAPHSYYTAIARAYIRKQGAAFREHSLRDPQFEAEVLPKIGRWIIPVLRNADGRIIQDSLDIIEFGEANDPAVSATPPGARQKLVSAICFSYGSQALLKPAMHYRWSPIEDQRAFLEHAFSIGRGANAAATMAKMNSYLPVLGVTAETIPLIEAAFETLLDRLEAHFSQYPYLLGGQPCLGDYGLFGPLFAHLGRDPVPCEIMKARAPSVFRWTERMHTTDPDMPEFDCDEAFLPDDAIPATLLAVLDFIGHDYGPEVSDRIAFLRNHLQATAPVDGDPVSDKPAKRAVGMTTVRYWDTTCDVAVQPYLLYCQRRVEDAFKAMSEDDQAWARQRLEASGLTALIAPDLPMTVGRRDNIEVWEAI